MSRARQRRERGGRWRRWLRRFLLLLPFIPALQVLAVRWIDPPISMLMWRQSESPDYRWRDWQRLAPGLPVALVAAEDQRFPEHHGFDFGAIGQALREARGRGASTISQQVAKNVFLWPGRSWLRKGLEAWYTLWIEVLWPKQRVLEVYANVAQFGKDIYGAEAAAQRFFGISAGALSAEQSALLAAVLPSPERWRADRPGPYVRARQLWVERQARQLGGIEYLRACCGVAGSGH